MGMGIGIILFIIGLAECFFGYKMFKALNMIKGFITGGLFCALIGMAIGAASVVNKISQITRIADIEAWLSGGETSVIVGAVIGFLVGGILGALLANALVILAVFFQSFVIGALFGGVMMAITRNYDLVLVTAFVTGLLLAITSCILFKHQSQEIPGSTRAQDVADTQPIRNYSTESAGRTGNCPSRLCIRLAACLFFPQSADSV